MHIRSIPALCVHLFAVGILLATWFFVQWLAADPDGSPLLWIPFGAAAAAAVARTLAMGASVTSTHVVARNWLWTWRIPNRSVAQVRSGAYNGPLYQFTDSRFFSPLHEADTPIIDWSVEATDPAGRLTTSVSFKGLLTGREGAARAAFLIAAALREFGCEVELPAGEDQTDPPDESVPTA